MNVEDYAFKSSNELFNRGLGIGDILEIITVLQEDRKQWINQYTIAHNDYVELQQENHQLKDNWNELKKFVREELKEAEDDFAQEDFIKVLDRMQELEGNNE